MWTTTKSQVQVRDLKNKKTYRLSWKYVKIQAFKKKKKNTHKLIQLTKYTISEIKQSSRDPTDLEEHGVGFPGPWEASLSRDECVQTQLSWLHDSALHPDGCH